MRTLFIHRSAARKLARRPQGIAKQTVKRLGVLGAGMMGAGIAQVAAAAGIDVVLLDTTETGAAAGKARIAAGGARDVRAGRSTQEQVDTQLARIHATPDYGELRGCDFVVEAVFEERARQGRRRSGMRGRHWALCSRFRDGDQHLDAAGQRPRGQLARARRIHRAALLLAGRANDAGRGHQGRAHVRTTRWPARSTWLSSWQIADRRQRQPGLLHEPHLLRLQSTKAWRCSPEAWAPALIENAAKQAGFATPPLAVTDEVSLDLQQRVIGQAEADGLPARFLRQHAKPRRRERCWHAADWGRKQRRRGSTIFCPASRSACGPGLAELFPRSAAQPELVDVTRRLLCMQALESARCVEEGVVPEPADADLGAVLALGFPSWTGGTLSFVDTVGPASFVAECDRLADRHGERFRPSRWLRERAHGRSAFYRA
jgi:3-hydroxyacyl-CoA dehydrogenase/enoyl-CoA hydratase/3-hydroxybutyryl-CoA epimerase